MKIIIPVLLSILNLLHAMTDNEISIGQLSFKDVNWDNESNMLMSRRSISEMTDQEQAVVLYFFEACYG